MAERARACGKQRAASAAPHNRASAQLTSVGRGAASQALSPPHAAACECLPPPRVRASQMVQFIHQEAKEKAAEIKLKTDEEFNIEKLRMVEAEKQKIRAEYERKEKQVEVTKRMYAARLSPRWVSLGCIPPWHTRHKGTRSPRPRPPLAVASPMRSGSPASSASRPAMTLCRWEPHRLTASPPHRLTATGAQRPHA